MSQTASWTCFIRLPPSWHFGAKAKVHSAGSGHGLGFPCAMYPEAPKAKKSCSSWGVGECHRQKLKHFVKRPSGPPTQKQTWPMEFSYWQLLFFHIQVCKFLFEDAAYEMIWMGTLWFLAPAGFQSPQRPPAPRQWHAQGQAWRKAAHEHDLAKNPSNFCWLRRFQMRTKHSTFWPTHLPRAVPIPKLILASLEVENLVFHWGIGQTVLYPRSLWNRNLWTLAAWGQRQGG